jgi:transposase
MLAGVVCPGDDLSPGAAGTGLATLVGLIRSLPSLLAVARYRSAAGVLTQAGAAVSGSHRSEDIVSTVSRYQRVVGVDTHLDTHTAVICDSQGRQLACTRVPATAAGYGQLLAWASAQAAGTPLAWAIESTRHYGLGLTRQLATAGQQAAEISSTAHVGKRRAGKTDAIDALRAARELLAAEHPAIPRADGDREALRLLIVTRDHAVRAGRSARALLNATIITAGDCLREQLQALPAARRARACAALASPPGADRLTTTQHQMLARLGQRILALASEAQQLETQIAAIVEDLAPGLVAAEPGLGYLSAAQILLAYSHPGRIRSEAAFAMLAGTAPLPASSGRTIRHRLSRLGDRQLNHALHTVITTRKRCHQPTRDYLTRRQHDGKTAREATRCLKRYLARHLFRELNRLDTT